MCRTFHESPRLALHVQEIKISVGRYYRFHRDCRTEKCSKDEEGYESNDIMKNESDEQQDDRESKAYEENKKGFYDDENQAYSESEAGTEEVSHTCLKIIYTCTAVKHLEIFKTLVYDRRRLLRVLSSKGLVAFTIYGQVVCCEPLLDNLKDLFKSREELERIQEIDSGPSL